MSFGYQLEVFRTHAHSLPTHTPKPFGGAPLAYLTYKDKCIYTYIFNQIYSLQVAKLDSTQVSKIKKLSIIFENVALMSRELQKVEGIITIWASLATMKAGL